MKTRWYKTPLVLLLALCLTLGGLPMTVLADDPANAPSLGYSIADRVSIDNYVIRNAAGQYMDIQLFINGTLPTLEQLSDDFQLQLVISEIPWREEESAESDLQEFGEKYFTCRFVEKGEGFGIRLELKQPIESLRDYRVGYLIHILRHDEVALTIDFGVLVEQDSIPITAADANPEQDINKAFDTGAGQVLELFEFDVEVPIIARIMNEDDRDAYNAEVYVSLTMGEEKDGESREKARGIAYYLDDVAGGVPDQLADKSIIDAIDLVTLNMNWPNDRIRIDTPEKMTVYRSNGVKLGETNTGAFDLVYAPMYYLGTYESENGGGTVVNPPTSGGGSSGRGGSSSGGSNTPDGSATTSTGTTSTAASRSSNVSASGTVNQNQITSEVAQAVAASSGNTAVVQTRNATSVSAATLRAMAAAAGEKSVVLYADTLTENGKSVQGRLYVEPDKLAGMSSDLLLSVKTDSKSTQAVERFFESHYQNDVEVIHCDQQGGFGANLQIAAKVDLSKLNTASLTFYSYDRTSNTYTRIPAPNYSVDSNGYLHFYTERAGDIIISDKPLVSK